jgi:hypothetical protein
MMSWNLGCLHYERVHDLDLQNPAVLLEQVDASSVHSRAS